MLKIYFNLHKRLFSVQEKVNGKWKVTRHVESITLKNAKLVVSEKGRQRVLREKRKSVHAYIAGEEYKANLACGGFQVSYNPYFNEGFIQNSRGIIKESPFVVMYVLNKKPQVFALEKL